MLNKRFENKIAFHALRIRISRVDCNGRHSSDSDRRSFNIETEIITSNLNLNNSVKIDLFCNSFKKYMDCMKSIAEAFSSTLLKIWYQRLTYAQY